MDYLLLLCAVLSVIGARIELHQEEYLMSVGLCTVSLALSLMVINGWYHV